VTDARHPFFYPFGSSSAWYQAIQPYGLRTNDLWSEAAIRSLFIALFILLPGFFLAKCNRDVYELP
jgi:hypothetical protein